MGWSGSGDEAAPNDEQHEHATRSPANSTVAFSPCGRQVAAPGIRRTARKLWLDDLGYAERRYALRQRGEYPG
jgi:hypothetical protein